MANNQSGAQSSSQESQKKLTFEKLTPTHLSDDEMHGYTQALDFVFQEDDLLNIAITGPYAAGKSSVIKTYEENHKKLNGIHISLSYFSPTLESKIKGKKKDHELAFEDELMLERKIINQLIHQIEPDKIPATEFKVKSESTILTKAIWAGAITFILSFLIFIDKTWLTNWQSEHNNIVLLLIIFSFFLIVYFIFYKILDLQSRNNLIRKLKIFENEIDISSSECDVSYFDKYLNEIIYILDKSKLDYIVFEDIDRYDDNLILNKLRELNYTYNKKQSKNKPKPIKFFYLIKDEIFESKERTKFFDYILPIVPVMDNSNSLGKMDELFKSQNIYSDFTNTFLDILSDYLDDIRLIKNICNEYIIYKTKLAHSAGWFKNENLLAIIIYKNIFPADYALTRLGLGQGVVHRIIESLKQKKNEVYQEQIKKINNEIQLRKEKINTIETYHLKNLDELDALFINIPQDIKNEYHYINRDDIFTLNSKEFIYALKKNNLLINNRYSKDHYYYHEHDCKQYFNKLEQNSEYQERKKQIKIITTNNKLTLKAEIKKLEQEKSQLKLLKKIAEIIKIKQNNGVAVDTLFKEHIGKETEDITENKKYEQYKAEYEKLSSSCYFPLLRVLIIQGYIDEYYSDYTSLFDEQGLSKNDTLFLRNINEYINTEWELELKKPEIVLQRLNADNANRFTGISVLNYSLLDYILEKSKTDDLSRFITILKSYFKTDFVNEYLARYYAFLLNQDTSYAPNSLYLFIEKFNEQFPQLWKYINLFDQKLYVYLSFIHNQPKEINKINEDGDLKKHIENSTDFLFIDDEWSTIFGLLNQKNLRIIDIVFSELDIKFKQIDMSTPKLLELVEENNHYQLNYINAKYILENQYNLAHFDGHIIQTILALNDDAPIKLYFQNQPEALVLSIAQSDIPTIDDSEQTALFILNHNDISLAVKTAYIDKLATIMTNLNEITDKDVWDKLLEKQKIAYSAKNIVHYFFNYKLEDEEEDEADGKSETRVINEQLVHFINQNTKNISSSEADLTSLIPKDDERSLFFRRITINLSLDDTKYRMLISWFNGRYYIDFNYQHIEKTKISILIKHKAIRLGVEQDLNFIRENYPDNILELITHNFEEYINKLREDDSLINHDEIINLLSTDLSVAQKTLLLGLTNDPISINYAKDSVELQKHILENNFNTDDLAIITNNQYYNSTTNVIKNKVKQLCIEYTKQTKQIKSICYNLLIELFTCEAFSLDDKYTLLCNHIPHLDAKKTYKALKTIEQDATNQSFFSNLFIAKRPTFENTALNQKIIEELNKKWQFKYKVENNKINAYGQKLVRN
ncbi:YobI family P-loop NTPase [Gilliamella mensalis]|uniref:YobI family P-loop NTPase n=1 Tax=Gilliamella mensalis TaxID=1908520 RepID=UPI000A15F1D9|nr:hypothetical protein [Gilliamella mensalis]